MSKSKAKLSLLALLLLTALFASQLGKLRFNYDFDMFFPKGDDNFDYYDRFKGEFGSDNDNLLIAIFDEDIASSRFLTALQNTIEEIESLPEIKEIFGLTNLYKYQITALGINKIRLVDPNEPLKKEKIIEHSQFLQPFIAKDQKSVIVNIRHWPFDIKKEADLFYENFESWIQDRFENVIVSGKIQAQNHFVHKLENELFTLVSLAITLIAIVLFLMFRTLKGVLVPFLVLIISSIWNLGLVALVGKDLDVMMVMVPPILLVIAMSDLVHFCSKYNELKSDNCATKDAVIETLRTVGAATLLTSISTAVGFATLIISPLPPIRDFGLFTAIGVLFAYIVTFSFLPSLFTLFEKPLNRKNHGELKWKKFMQSFFLYVLNKRKKILFTGIILTLLLAGGITLLRQNTFIIVGLKKSDPLLQKIQYFDENYGGAKTIEIAVNIKGNELFDPAILAELDKFSNYLKTEYGIVQLVSPLETVKLINGAIHGPTHYKTPSELSEIKRIKQVYLNDRFSEIRGQIESDNLQVLRFTGRIRDIGSYKSRLKNQALMDFYGKEINNELLSYRLTGTSYLVDSTDKYVATSLLKGLGFGLILISILLTVLFRSLRFTLVSLVPNIIPLLVLAGMLGYMGIDINITTMLIFGIAFGIAVDDSIHFLSRYQQELRSGKGPIYATKRTFISTGKSIVLTTIILAAGFALFIASGFSATYYTGIFVGITLIVAVIADLMILPLLLLRK